MVAVGSGEGAPPDPLVKLDQNYRMSVGEKEKNSIVKATLAKAGEVKGTGSSLVSPASFSPIFSRVNATLYSTVWSVGRSVGLSVTHSLLCVF